MVDKLITFGHDVRFSMLLEPAFFASRKIKSGSYPSPTASKTADKNQSAGYASAAKILERKNTSKAVSSRLLRLRDDSRRISHSDCKTGKGRTHMPVSGSTD